MKIFEDPIKKINEFRSRNRVNDPLKAEAMARSSNKPRTNVAALLRGDIEAERIFSWRGYANSAGIKEELAAELYDKVKLETDKIDDSQLEEAIDKISLENEEIQNKYRSLNERRIEMAKQGKIAEQEFSIVTNEESAVYKKKEELGMTLFILYGRLAKKAA